MLAMKKWWLLLLAIAVAAVALLMLVPTHVRIENMQSGGFDGDD
jgi:hypothetical protein